MSGVDIWFKRLTASVIWPPAVTHYGNRLPAPHPDSGMLDADQSIAAAYRSTKLRRLVIHRNRRVLEFVRKLDAVSAVRSFRETPFALRYHPDGATSAIAFWPDLLLLLEDGRCFIVEISTHQEMATHQNWQKWRELRQFCRRRGFGLLVTDGTRSFQQFARSNTPESSRSALMGMLQYGPLSEGAFELWQQEFDLSPSLFYAIIIQERLVYRPEPFLLSLPDLAHTPQAIWEWEVEERMRRRSENSARWEAEREFEEYDLDSAEDRDDFYEELDGYDTQSEALIEENWPYPDSEH